MTQLSTSVAKSTAAFGKAQSSLIAAIWNRLPRITYLLRPQEVTWYRYFSFSEATVKVECHPVILQDFLGPALRKWNILESSFSKKEHSANMLRMCDGYWMTSSQTSGLVELDQLLGHLLRLFWPHWATLYGVMLRPLCFHRNRILLYEFKVGITTAFHETQRICSEMVYGIEWRVLSDGGHIEGWNFEMCCLEAIKLRFYTGCLCQCTFKVSIVEI